MLLHQLDGFLAFSFKLLDARLVHKGPLEQSQLGVRDEYFLQLHKQTSDNKIYVE